MIRDNEHWAQLTESFYAAALDGKSWYPALEGLAHATGSRCGELIGIGPDGALPFNIMTGVEPELPEAIAAARGGDPAVNPRVAAGMAAPVLQVLAENDFISPEERRRHPHYQELADPWDIPHICLATLARQEGLLIGLAVLRSARQGPITDAERGVFAAMARHVQGAVRTHLALQDQGEALLLGTLERLTIPAFVCDHQGVVRALTPAADSLLAQSELLRMTGGRLQGVRAVESRALQDAIDAAALAAPAADQPLLRTIVMRGKDMDDRPLVLEVVRLPRQPNQLSFNARVLVIARAPSAARSSTAAILQAAYGLTTAEADVAVMLREGARSDTIAEHRGVAVGTVRVQIKSVLAKLNVRSQLQLVARLRQL